MMWSSMRGMRWGAVALAASLSACSSLGGTDMSPGSLLSGGRDPAAEQKALELFAPVTLCPDVQVRDGTQLILFPERNRSGEATAIRFQGSIQKFARECRTDRATGITTIRVGVAGRLLAGPSGATGSVTLPLRVAVLRNGDDLVYSKLLQVPAAIETGQSSLTWTQVVEDIQIPPEKAQGRYVIYVGFDEGELKS